MRCSQVKVALALALLAVGITNAAAKWCDYQSSIVYPVKACCEKGDTCDPAIFKTDGPYTNTWDDKVALWNGILACKASYGEPKKDLLCKCARNCPASGAQGDPHIKCFDGSNYLLWGKPNTTYSLVSEKRHQINVRLYHPAARPEAHALYIDAVGALINGARITVSLVPGSPSSLVLGVNGGAVTYPGHRMERAVDMATSFTFVSARRVEITSHDIVFAVVLVENDHLDLQLNEVAAYWSNVHGIIGQTHSKAFQLKYSYAEATVVGDLPSTQTMAANKKQLALKGKEDDYITSGLLEADDSFNRFEGSAGMATAAPVTATRKVLFAGSALLAKTSAGAVSGASAHVMGDRKLLYTAYNEVPKPVYTCQ